MSEASPHVEPAAPELRCPICSANAFVTFNKRKNARCSSCQAMERTRLLWLILERYGLFRPGLRVMHVAPELPLAKRFSELLGDRYYACDLDAARYKSTFTRIRPVDLCNDLVKLPSRSFDVIIHSHVLEHLRCDPEAVLTEFERILAPGGHHFLSVPVSGDTTREDLTDDPSPEERAMLFGQADHFRIFGKHDLPQLLKRVWGEGEEHLIEPLALFGATELERAAIPEEAWSGISSHAIFHRRRHGYVDVALRPGPAEASSDAGTPAVVLPTERPRLILHIGMPKAGTTSLQRWLASHREAALATGLDYWPIAENHSEAVFMAFADPDRIARGTMWFQRGAAPENDAESAERAFDAFVDGLDERTGFVSAEVLWTFPRRDVDRLAAHLRDRGITPLVLCWVRPPADYLTSTVQQRARGTLSIDDLGLDLHGTIHIQYRRLDAWLENFGREHMAVLPLGDDIVDQASGLLRGMGMEIAPASTARRQNPAISLLAAKALLALNARQGTGRKQSHAARQLRTTLQRIKGDEFRLPESLIKRSSRLFQREADYLHERFGIDKDWLLAQSTAVDDARFYSFSVDEVAALLEAVERVLGENAQAAVETGGEAEDDSDS
jgi:hypothetical protein